MPNTPKLILKDPRKSLSKDFNNKTPLKEIVKFNNDNAEYVDAEIVIEDGERKVDPYSPVNIKVVQLLNDKKKKTTTAGEVLSGVVISCARPSDWTATLTYQGRLYNKEFKTFDEKAVALTYIKIENNANTEYDLKDCSNEFVYYFLPKSGITYDAYTNNYLVQIQRKLGNDWKDWGTELHTNFTFGGKADIFQTAVELSYSSGDENIGLKPGQSITVEYANILKEEFAKNMPKRIFPEKPETSLMGVAVKVSKLNYNTRRKTFNLAVNLNTNEIKIEKDEELLAFYQKSYETKDTVVPEDAKAVITNLKQKGIQLLPGVHIKEVYFEVNITDEPPTEA